MIVSRFRFSAVARALAASAAIGLASLYAAPASAALSASEAADANLLAELIVNATLQANVTPDNPQTSEDETRGAIEEAIQSTIERFQSGQASPDVVAEAMFLAKAKLVQGEKWCPGSLAATKSAVKSRAAPEREKGCSMAGAFDSVSTTVQAAQDNAPSATGPEGGNAAIPPASGLSGGGAGVSHSVAQ
jgi:hypothetical protein